jgi:hypothetical protein
MVTLYPSIFFIILLGENATEVAAADYADFVG